MDADSFSLADLAEEEGEKRRKHLLQSTQSPQSLSLSLFANECEKRRTKGGSDSRTGAGDGGCPAGHKEGTSAHSDPLGYRAYLTLSAAFELQFN